MFASVMKYFYPDFKDTEIKKFGLLGITFIFTIGTYWILRLLKDVLIYELAFPTELGWALGYGRELVPHMKLVSWITVFVVVAIYSKLVDMFEKHKLFYIIGAFYAILFSVITAVLILKDVIGAQALGWFPLAAACIAGYLATESFGSLVIALFWSFTISSTKSDEAKRGFPFIIAISQIGSIGGSSLVYFNLSNITLLCICILMILAIVFMINYTVKAIPKEDMTSDKVEKKQKADMFAGLKLLFTRPYLMGVLVVSTFYEIAKTIVDYQMKSQAILAPSVNFKQFLGIYGMSTNGLALLMALLGTSYVMKRFGLRVCLLVYPILFGLSMIGLYFYYLTNPTAEALLWATFGVMMFVTAISYAVNNPTKEMMYIPTSKDAKFKAKSIIDMIGGRSSKMAGAQIGGLLNVKGQPMTSIANLMGMGTLISLGIIGLWLLVAIYVGYKNAQLVRENKMIE